jgi:opacity protein-like surface antigen
VGRLTFLSVMSAITFGLAGHSARAADLLPPPPILDEADEVVELGTGWYLRGDLGYVNYDRPRDVGFGIPGELPLDGERLEKAFSVGGGIGYQVTDWLRTDLTVDHRFGAQFSGTRPNPSYDIGFVRDQADFESTTLLLNGYIDLAYWSGITPYLGAGIGVSGNRFTNVDRDVFVGGTQVSNIHIGPHTTTNLAWALMAGIAVDVGSGFTLDLGYRYTHLGDVRTQIDAAPGIKTDEIRSHELRFGARYMID